MDSGKFGTKSGESSSPTGIVSAGSTGLGGLNPVAAAGVSKSCVSRVAAVDVCIHITGTCSFWFDSNATLSARASLGGVSFAVTELDVTSSIGDGGVKPIAIANGRTSYGSICLAYVQVRQTNSDGLDAVGWS